MTALQSATELLQAQLHAVDAWHAARAAAERARATAAASRETRMDLARRMEVLQQQHQAIVERTEVQLRDSIELLRNPAPMRAIVAHRNAWFTDRVAAALREHRVEVVAQLTNGAHAVGCAVAEQPDLMLVEDVLPMLSGVDVVRQVRQFAPATVVGAHVEHADRVAQLLDAGAHGAWPRKVPPVDVSQELLGLLRRRLQPTA